MKTVLVVIGIILWSGYSIVAQPVCGFDQSNGALQQENPIFKRLIEQNEQKIGQFIQLRKTDKRFQQKTMAIFTIPIVVHVLHTGEPVGTPFNPSDQQIHDAINYLNAIFDGSHASLTPAGTDAAGDMGLRFVLAQRDPDCNPTTGIHRVDMSDNASYLANGASNMNISEDIAMKSPVAWDRTQYYNIYVVNKINGKDGTSGQFVAGYAYFPTSSIVDGIVMLATQMKAGSKTLSHEIGHAFNLYHTFEGSHDNSQCPAAPGDRVNDTDPVAFNANSSGVVDFTCRTGNNSCINQPYNIRTENNFMSYTNCYTLFTPGQKDRVQASVLLAERNSLTTSSGGLPTNVYPTCAPKINFEQSIVSVTRTATGINGCLRFNDYQFNLTIGGDPLQNAIITLVTDPVSTAMEGRDFEFPLGKVVVFPAGSNNNRSFTVRILDNGSSLDVRELRLRFLLDNSGGVAEMGTLTPFLDIQIQPHDYSPVAPGTIASATIGASIYQITSAKIFDATLAKQKTQILYRAGELLAAGLSEGSAINGMSFLINKKSNRPLKNVEIRIAQTSITNLVNGGSLQLVGSMVTVLSEPAYTTMNGWNSFAFTQPFTWDGVSSIAVEFCFNNGTTAAGTADVVHAYSDGSETGYGNMIEDGTVNCSQNFASVSYYQNGVKPLVVLDYAMYGNPVERTVAQSKEEYLGPFSEVYFYDQVQPERIIARIRNLSAWNYGCTSVSIDRAGDGTQPFWNNAPGESLTQKSFFVTPQFNNPSGAYEIALYYTEAEKTGYEQATGNNWSNVKMIKTEIPVPTVTPETPEPDKVQVNAIVEHESFGADHVVKATFNTGFSGFALGITEAVLPVRWLSFVATNKRGNVVLQWATAMEFNNSFFDIQVSYDGTGFVSLGRLPSKGNRSAITEYEYVHVRPGAGKIYYRVQQVDRDGKNSYSKIIEVNISGGNSEPSLYPVPAKDNITLHFGKPVANAFIEILTSDLKQVYFEKINGMSLTKNINTGRWTAGTYFVRLTIGHNHYVLKFVKL
ncbi:MAG: zinc-dependent metalloprotease [Chitinophagaceae bacterium]|nr:zinc-dependent metalloprotease [Chitinophagaceae bacterium]